MRRVMVRKYTKCDDGEWRYIDAGEAVFHAFGVDYEQGLTTAIVEYPDGQLSNVSLELVRFIDPPVPPAAPPADLLRDQEPLGAECEAVWDANTAVLYES